MNQIQIPKKWKSWYLNEIRLDKSQTIIPNKTKDQKFELYSVPAYNTGKPEIISGRDIGSNKQTVEEETVLLCKINPQINRVWIVSNHSSFPKIASTEWISFFKQDFINPKYLFYFLQNANFRKFLCQNVSGIGGSLTRIRPSVLNHYIIPVPTLEIQKKIVQKLDYILGQLEERKKEILQLINKFESKEILKSYQNRLLNLAFSGKLTEEELIFSEEYQMQIPKGWKRSRFGDLIDLKHGHQFRTSDYVKDTGYKVFKIGQLEIDNKIDLSNCDLVSKSRHGEFKDFIIKKGDILMALTGATLGRVVRIEEELDVVFQNYRVGNFKLKNDKLIYDYLYYLLQSDLIFNQVFDKINRAAQPNIGKENFENIEIIYPEDKKIQKRIVQKLDDKFTEMEKYQNQIIAIEKKLENTKKSLDLLTSSVLNSAFTGKLVN